MIFATGIGVITPTKLEHDLRVAHPFDLGIELVLKYLEDNRPMMREIADAVCELYCVNSLTERKRQCRIVLARQVFCYFAYRYTRHSLKAIGRRAGVTDHTTVMHSVQKIEEQAITDPLLADDIDLLRLRISEKVLLRPGRRV